MNMLERFIPSLEVNYPTYYYIWLANHLRAARIPYCSLDCCPSMPNDTKMVIVPGWIIKKQRNKEID
jgi:hypothetical protein